MHYELGLLLVLRADLRDRLGVDAVPEERAEGIALLEALEVSTASPAAD
jgi:hypothetical protein